MKTAEPARRLSRAATTALRELPGNTAWLLAKALEPAASTAGGASRAVASAGDSVSETASTVTGTAGAAASGIRRKTKAARRSVAEALPGAGHDPVASLLQQADAAAERAREEETRALELAQEAKDSADEAGRVARESGHHVQEVRREAERKVAARVE